MFKHVEHIYMLKLVGGFNLSEKYESVGMIIPNILYGKSKNVPNHQSHARLRSHESSLRPRGARKVTPHTCDTKDP